MAINTTKIKKAVQDAFDDISTLEVATLTDPVGKAIDLKTADTNKKVFAAIKTNLANANLVAYTKYELDGDSINFITQKDELADLVTSHGELVKSSIETRKALFTTVYDAVKSLF